MNMKLIRLTVRPELLRRAREASGLTQAQAARALGISRQSIWSYEHGRGRPSADVFLRMCVLYRITPDQFAGRASTNT